MAQTIRQPCDEGIIHSAPETHPCSQTTGFWVLVATILGSSIAMIDGTAVNVALPVLQKSLNAGVAELQWIVEAYALFLAALILVGGSLGDRYGRKLIFGIGVALFTLASIGCGFAQNSTQLIVVRAIQGIGGALLVPGSLAIISTTFSKEQRGRAIGTWSGFTVITGALGPVLGGWLVENVSWRAVFFLNVPLAIIILVVLFWKVPESRDEEDKGRLDWLGALLTIIGLGGIVYGLITATNLSLGSPIVISSLIVGCVALAAFVFVESRSPAPMMPLSLFQSRIFSGANLFTLLLYTAFGSTFFFLPYNLIQIQDYTAAAAGAALLPLSLIVFLLSRWAGGLINRYGARLPLVVGSLVVACAMGLYMLPSIGGSYWITFFPAIVVQSIGISLVAAPLTTVVMGSVESQHVGLASGINNAVARTAGLLSVAVMSIVFLGAFAASLNSSMTELNVPQTLHQQIIEQQTKLAQIQIPATVTGQAREAIQHAINGSFVTGFRVVMLIAALLALVSTVIAWFSFGKEVPAKTPEEMGKVRSVSTGPLESGQPA